MALQRKFPILVLGLILICALTPVEVSAQSGIEVVAEAPEYTFADQIVFKGGFSSANGLIEEVLLIIQINGESDVRVHAVTLDDQGNGVTTINLKETQFPPFSEVEYWYQMTDAEGEVFNSATYVFTYVDNRFDWKSLEGAPFRIHWYAGELTFGEQVLNTAYEGLLRAQELMEVYFPDQVDIYVYADAQALQGAIPYLNQNWVAGHAKPGNAVIMVSLPESLDQQLEMERQIPHEMMHVALNYTDANAFSNLPTWFNEGLASMVELYPNPDYQVLIENAFESGDLFPIASLCLGFPNEAQDAQLAYAESATFTRYLYEQFGQHGFNRLIAAYASGMSCERGVEQALGIDLTRLDGNWRREDFSSQVWTTAGREVLPWLVLMLVILAGPLILVIVIFRKRPRRMDT
jgi:hypothetical protein